MVLQLDLTRDARRDAILQQVLAALDDDARARVDAQANAAVFHKEHYHDIGEVREAIDALDVSARVKADMHGVYEVLAAAEAAVHGCPVEHTHFHEVGRAAGLRNTLNICLAMEAAVPGGAGVAATAVQTGSGTVDCAHGTMDIPAPATAAILAGGEGTAPVPVCTEKLEGELCTPTSAAIIRHFVTEWI